MTQITPKSRVFNEQEGSLITTLPRLQFLLPLMPTTSLASYDKHSASCALPDTGFKRVKMFAQ